VVNCEHFATETLWWVESIFILGSLIFANIGYWECLWMFNTLHTLSEKSFNSSEAEWNLVDWITNLSAQVSLRVFSTDWSHSLHNQWHTNS
jgi:hypothetical protein